jgi:hypothetical protein
MKHKMVHMIGITGHNEEEIASMTKEEQARCFIDADEMNKSKSAEKPKKK